MDNNIENNIVKEEKKKGNKKSIVVLSILVVVFGIISVLSFLGIFNKDTFTSNDKKTSTVTDKTSNSGTDIKKSEDKKVEEVKKTETKTITETRYYQYVSNLSQQKDNDGNPEYMTSEIELNVDGTAKIAYKNMSDSDDKKGIYVENNKYVVLELNNPREQCTDDNYMAEIADSCTDNIILIKDGDTLKTQRGALLHFEIDNVNKAIEYKPVQKTDLQTSLKD